MSPTPTPPPTAVGSGSEGILNRAHADEETWSSCGPDVPQPTEPVRRVRFAVSVRSRFQLASSLYTRTYAPTHRCYSYCYYRRHRRVHPKSAWPSLTRCAFINNFIFFRINSFFDRCSPASTRVFTK